MLGAMAVIACAACSKDNLSEVDPQPLPSEDKVAMTFSAGSENSEDFKSFIQDDMSVAWVDADEIAVFDGSAKNVFTIKSNLGTSAVFEGEVTKGSTEFYAAYPAAAASALDNGAITTTIPTEQVVPEGKNIGAGALVSVAKNNNGTFAFKNVPGLFKFTISDANITSVTISSIGGENLSGEVKVTVSDEPSFEVVEGVSRVTVRPQSGAFAAGTYYATVLPGEYKGGLAVVMTRSTDALGGVMQGKSDVTIPRNGGADLKTLSATEWGTYITNLTELQNWSKSGDFTKAAILGADIEVGDWASYYRNGTGLSGNFYGLGHKLYNITCNPSSGPCGFLYQPTKKVCNLIIGSKDGKTYDGVSKFTLGASTNGYCGFFTYSAKGTEVDAVTNFATFEISTAHTGTAFARVGSLVGAPNGGTFKNCKNYGKVICNAQTTGGEINVGGFFGFFDAPGATIIDCENFGEIENNSSQAMYVGGISGRTSGSAAVSCTNVKNHGKITVNAGQPSINVGGTVAAISSTSATLVGCENDGQIIVNYAPSSTLYLGGVIAYIGNDASTGKIEKCKNTADLSYGAKATNVYIAGIIANTYGTKGNADVLTLTSCTNDGNITVNSTKAIIASGICGYAKNITINSNINNGKISIDNASTATTGMMDAGGIIGYSHDVVKFSGNTNNGEISVKSNTSKWTSAGGIVGDLYWVKVGKTNVNNAAVTSVNADATAPASAGGFYGSDFSNGGQNGNWAEQNKNYGDITATAASGLGYAGGIVGYGKCQSFWKNYNYGAIVGSDLTITGSCFGYIAYRYAYAYSGGSVNGNVLTAENWSTYKMGTSSTAAYQESEGSFVTK